MSISVVIPTYERVDAVARLCRAIAPQLADGDELIVIDDGVRTRVPTDLPGTRVIRNASNLGMVGNWNKCFEVAGGEWVCTVHDDDEFALDGLATLRRAIGRMDAPGVVVGGTLPGEREPTFRYRYAEPGRWAVLHATTIPSGAAIHRRVFETLGAFDARFAFSSDLELFPRYATAFPTLWVESPAVVTYRIHGSNYQYKTWRDPAFLGQLEAIVRQVGVHAGLSGDALDRYAYDSITAHLSNIMANARKIGDRDICRGASRGLLRRERVPRRARAWAWYGALTGR